jgi:hypothetical protein
MMSDGPSDQDNDPAHPDRPLRHPLDSEEAARAIGAAAGEGEAKGPLMPRSPMTDLTASLQVLFRHYAAAIDLHPEAVDRLCKEFRQKLGVLIAKYGQAAVDKAIDEIPEEAWPSVGLH